MYRLLMVQFGVDTLDEGVDSARGQV
jgi:hypothetical protein